MERKFYRIEAGSELATTVAQFIEDMKAVRKSWKSFLDKHGGKERWTQGSRVVGLSFEGESPEGWYRPRDCPAGCYRPYANRKASKEAYAEFKALPFMPGGSQFSARIGFESTSGPASGGRGMMIYWASFEEVSGETLISLPENGEPVPGCIPLKNSEYWQMKEAAA